MGSGAADLSLTEEALRIAELHDQLAASYEIELMRTDDLLRHEYLSEMITRQRVAAEAQREFASRTGIASPVGATHRAMKHPYRE